MSIVVVIVLILTLVIIAVVVYKRKRYLLVNVYCLNSSYEGKVRLIDSIVSNSYTKSI